MELHFTDAPVEVLWERIQERNRTVSEGSFKFTREDLELWLSWFQEPKPQELFTYDNYDPPGCETAL